MTAPMDPRPEDESEDYVVAIPWQVWAAFALFVVGMSVIAFTLLVTA